VIRRGLALLAALLLTFARLSAQPPPPPQADDWFSGFRAGRSVVRASHGMVA
jgi:hypothetical protein